MRAAKHKFLSTLSLRRATCIWVDKTQNAANFYPRSPCGERQRETQTNEDRYKFLSTLSLRRATGFSYFYIIKITDFYPRSPCGERPVYGVLPVSTALISIHALLAESDLICLSFFIKNVLFLSTLSLRRATKSVNHFCNLDADFYPRSPCGERPDINVGVIGGESNFYPRSPCGERLSAKTTSDR